MQVGREMPSKTVRIVYLVMIFIVPYLLIYVSGLPHWVGRLIGISIFVVLLTVGIFAYSLSPNVKMILAGGKLSLPEYAQVRPKVEKAIRVLGVAFGLFFTIYVSIPFAVDMGSVLASNAPVVITGQVRLSSSPLLGMVFLKQSVFLQGPAASSRLSYSLLYSLSPIHPGRKYQLQVLPRSRIIVDYAELKD
jgi:hypothetical protein